MLPNQIQPERMLVSVPTSFASRIASALIGYGLFSLFRTDPREPALAANMVDRATALTAAATERVRHVSGEVAVLTGILGQPAFRPFDLGELSPEDLRHAVTYLSGRAFPASAPPT